MDPVNLDMALGKYWIKPGMYVREKTSGQVMFVDRINRIQHKKEIDPRTGRLKVRTLGVVCSWMDSTNNYRQAQFHTKQLEPHEGE